MLKRIITKHLKNKNKNTNEYIILGVMNAVVGLLINEPTNKFM